MKIKIKPINYHLYILECRNGTLYTGIAIDVAKRFAMHCSGKGAKYTRMHPPIRIVQSWNTGGGRGHALKIENHVKRLGRTQKLKLIAKPKLLSKILKQICAGQAPSLTRLSRP